ncbi:linoleate 9S-lipoxygenase A-like [Cryptomeria japonica]|uniref:linoleate 9S-lipoxygenase A-like n=1 Tax=Cryptomeria japonica TaxID=3369 RepID=UPI0027DA31B1|nr:linoleate 9S-lipoxygenase A-like [Cryptomeria japonica]
MSLFGNISLPTIPTISLPSKNGNPGVFEIKGELVLMKAYLADVTDYSATIADTVSELIGQKVFLQLVSSDKIHEDSGLGKKGEVESISWNPLDGPIAGDSKFSVSFTWKTELGLPGALLVRNAHPREFFLKSLSLSAVPGKLPAIRFVCNSWIHPYYLFNKTDRVFFTTQSHLPNETPAGLLTLRKRELASLRGNGTGERKFYERVYDYDLYNDLGNPDSSPDLRREVLGGSQDLPYPRRCRTGRAPCKTDRKFESLPLLPTTQYYIPPDEKFPRINLSDYRSNLVRAFAKKVVPTIKSIFGDEFHSLQEVKDIYSKGIPKALNNVMDLSRDLIPLQMVKGLLSTQDQSLINFTVPQLIKADENAWKTDEEFARHALSGLNPMAIQCLQSFPPTSSLDADLYGPQNSSITAEHIEKNLNGLTVQQAVEAKRLFILDYYDAYMPYIERINKESDERKMYASRTLFFLTDQGILRVVAIELCLPHTSLTQAERKVYTPAQGGEDGALWLLAKAHSRVNDAGYHQLISHWLRTHAVIEPFIIATHRHLSKMHPLHKLLLPHYFDTMDINQSARQILINANGVIEEGFTPYRYAIELSSKAYKHWKLNEQGLPADLIKRGMAVADSTAPHGLRLAIEDYPYAVDGLEIWDALKQWVSDYVSLYYKSDDAIKEDTEVQTWWKEAVNVGHGDLKKESGWYQMESVEEAAEAITTIIWIASAHHAAVNFGQYAYGGYMPNLPTLSRRLIPEQHSLDYAQMMKDPEAFMLSTVSNPNQATTVMAVLELLSKHSTDEAYLGQVKGSTHELIDDEGIEQAFGKFSAALAGVEKNVSERNKNSNLKNRYGPSQVPYTLLYPNTTDLSREGGLTGRGIPNSVSI